MATEYIGNVLKTPGFHKGNVAVNGELLQSTEGGFTQKGVTLKAGQGLLRLGTILARETSSKKYVRYNNAGSGGAEVPLGVLRQSVFVGDEDVPANIVKAGILNLALMNSANSSGAVAASLTSLNARVDNPSNWFVF